jgi:hypothetical protein
MNAERNSPTLVSKLLLAGAVAAPALTSRNPTPASPAITPSGWKASIRHLPPPGFYLRDYNLFYGAGQLNDSSGDKMDMDFEAFVYANAIRPVWITDLKIPGRQLRARCAGPADVQGH